MKARITTTTTTTYYNYYNYHNNYNILQLLRLCATMRYYYGYNITSSASTVDSGLLLLPTHKCVLHPVMPRLRGCEPDHGTWMPVTVCIRAQHSRHHISICSASDEHEDEDVRKERVYQGYVALVVLDVLVVFMKGKGSVCLGE